MSTAALVHSTSLGACAGSASASAGAPAVAVSGSRRQETAMHLAGGRAASLRADVTRVLRVQQGRVWLTRDATASRATEDIVLSPGESLTVAAGERLVLEPWDARGATYAWDALV
jgi:hypothetical protein